MIRVYATSVVYNFRTAHSHRRFRKNKHIERSASKYIGSSFTEFYSFLPPCNSYIVILCQLISLVLYVFMSVKSALSLVLVGPVKQRNVIVQFSRSLCVVLCVHHYNVHEC